VIAEARAHLSNRIMTKEARPMIPALLVVLGGIALGVLDFFSGELIPTKGLALIAAGSLYLLVRKRLPSDLREGDGADGSRAQGQPASVAKVLLNAVFLLALAITLFAVAASEAYTMPVTYFVTAPVMCVVVALEILMVRREKTPYTKLILGKIVILSLMLIWLPHYKFPNIGFDPWYHMGFVEDILNQSHIPSVGHEYYTSFAAMHLIVAGAREVAGLSTMSSMMVVGSIGVAGLLLLYCIGSMLFNERIGLLGALLFGISSDFILWGYYVIPMSLGIGLAAALVYSLIRGADVSRRLTFRLVFLLLVFVLIYTHTIVGAVCLVIIGSMYLGERFVRRWERQTAPAYLSLVTPVLFGVGLLAYWSYVSGYFFTGIVRNLAHVFSFPETGFTYAALPVDSTPSIVRGIGFMVLIGLSVVAILYIWERRERHRKSLMLVGGGVGLVVFLYVAFASGQVGVLLPDRWQVFVFLLLSVVAGGGMFLVYRAFRRPLPRVLAVTVLALLFAFTMVFNSLSGHSNPFIDKTGSQRGFFYDSEIAAAQTIAGVHDGAVTCDLFYAEYFVDMLDRETVDIYYSFIVPDEPGAAGAVVVRQYLVDYTFLTMRPAEVQEGYASLGVLLDDTRKEKLAGLEEDTRYSKVYCNDEVAAYVP